MDRENKTLESFIDTLSFALAKEFIRKSKEDEEKPSSHIHLFRSDLQTLLEVSGRMYEYLSEADYTYVTMSYNEDEIEGRYNLNIGDFINVFFERYKKAKAEGREFIF